MIAAWFIAIGFVLCTMALLGSVVDRLPLSSSLIYLVLGVVLGPAVLGWLDLRIAHDAEVLQILFLVTVLVSLFTVGLKLRISHHPDRLFSRVWSIPLRLAVPAMIFTIAFVAIAGHLFLRFEWPAALLLGAMLAPTDPVLASDIQVRHEDDRDNVRFSLTAEGGLNDATAAPFVLLALGLLGLHGVGGGAWHWVGADLLWAVPAGFAIGWLCGLAVGALVSTIRKRYAAAYGLEEFLGLGVIALSYGLADAVHALGFLSVLAAGLAMRRIETKKLVEDAIDPAVATTVADDGTLKPPDKSTLPPESPTHMVGDVLDFNQRFESIGEVGAVLVVGALLSAGQYDVAGLWLAAGLFLVIRPLSVWLATLGTATTARHKRLIGWFGIRGVGSLYYLAYSIDQGLPDRLVERLGPLVLTVVAASIVVHGISATPLMTVHERRSRRRDGVSRDASVEAQD